MSQVKSICAVVIDRQRWPSEVLIAKCGAGRSRDLSDLCSETERHMRVSSAIQLLLSLCLSLSDLFFFLILY